MIAYTLCNKFSIGDLAA
jgi:hypothetical protein